MTVTDQVNSEKITWFRSRLLSWYQAHGRKFPWRKETPVTVYEVIVTEVLLQRTKAETVARIYDEFMQRYPSWQALAQADQGELRELVVTLGLWRRRTETLLRLAKAIVEQGGIPSLDRESLEALPGVGQYIANAVLSICRDQREPMLDVNMTRVLERVFGPRKMADIRYDPYLQELSRAVLPEKNSRQLNWAVLDLGALVCTERHPRCQQCPLLEQCPSAHHIGEKWKNEGIAIQGNSRETVP